MLLKECVCGYIYIMELSQGSRSTLLSSKAGGAVPPSRQAWLPPIGTHSLRRAVDLLFDKLTCQGSNAVWGDASTTRDLINKGGLPGVGRRQHHTRPDKQRWVAGCGATPAPHET